MEINSIGKTMMLFGIILFVLGAIFTLGGKVSWFGRLPGDIYIQKKNFSFFFPLATSILISIVLSIILILSRKR